MTEIRIRVLGNEMLEIADDHSVLVAFRIVGGDWRGLRSGEKTGEAVAVVVTGGGGGCGGGGGGLGLRGARVGLAAGAGALVEDGAVDLREEEFIGEVGIDGGGGAEGEGEEVRLGQLGHVYNVGERVGSRGRQLLGDGRRSGGDRHHGAAGGGGCWCCRWWWWW